MTSILPPEEYSAVLRAIGTSILPPEEYSAALRRDVEHSITLALAWTIYRGFPCYPDGEFSCLPGNVVLGNWERD